MNVGQIDITKANRTLEPLDLPTLNLLSCNYAIVRNTGHWKCSAVLYEIKANGPQLDIYALSSPWIDWMKAWFSFSSDGNQSSQRAANGRLWQQQQVAGGEKTPLPNKQGIRTKHCWETITWALSVQIRFCFSCTVLHGASLGETVFFFPDLPTRKEKRMIVYYLAHFYSGWKVF